MKRSTATELFPGCHWSRELFQGCLAASPPTHSREGKKKSIPPVHAGFAKMVNLLHRRTAELGFSLRNNNDVGCFDWFFWFCLSGFSCFGVSLAKAEVTDMMQ